MPQGISEVATDHRNCGLLYHIHPQMSDFDEALALAAWQQNAAQNLLRAEILCRYWPCEDPPLIFKGGDLIENLYRDPGARHSDDLDFIAPPGKFELVRSALQAHSSEIRKPEQAHLPGEKPYSLGFLIEGQLFELHLDPFPNPPKFLSGSELYARSQKSGEFAFPSSTDRVLLQIAHRAKDAFETDLLDMVDLALSLKACTDSERSKMRALFKESQLEAAAIVVQRRLHELHFFEHDFKIQNQIAELQAELASLFLQPADSAKRAMPPTWQTDAIKLLLTDSKMLSQKLPRAIWQRLCSFVKKQKFL